MASDELDLLDDVDALIRDMEQTAPQEEFDPTKPRCENCDFDLEEEEDGNFICPNCQAQATNIQQLEDTEMFIASTDLQLGGRATRIRKKPCGEDYGFAWSTDQAIFEILLGQLKALKEAKIVDDIFCKAVLNMWTCFWLKFIGPVIKDSYDADELITWDKAKFLKERDFQVLVAKDDKFFVPTFRSSGKKPSRVSYTSKSTKFVNPDRKYKQDKPPSPTHDDNPREKESKDNNNDNHMESDDDNDDVSIDDLRLEEKLVASVDDLIKTMKKKQLTRKAYTTILTLDRTLAFIEAAARVLEMSQPIFASDIVRWCNYRLIPYFGAQNLLPDGINLNQHDMLMFSKRRSPKPENITSFACRLLMTIYKDELPKKVRRPNLSHLLERLIRDMNLPYDLFTQIDNKLDYEEFTNTKTKVLKFTKLNYVVHIPQYDRWAFMILVCHLKRLFNMDPTGIKRQHRLAQEKTKATGQRHFSFLNWSRQLCLRLKLVLKYDPYILYHPITNVKNLCLTPALTKYIESIIDDRPIIDIKLDQAHGEENRRIREELAEFLYNEIPRPDSMLEQSSINDDIRNQARHLKVRDFIHPFSDAFKRIRSMWKCENPFLKNLIDDDFASDKLYIDPKHMEWSIYEGQVDEFRILHSWPGCFKIILELGAYLFFCEPEDFLFELSAVNDIMFQEKKLVRFTKQSRRLKPNRRAILLNLSINGSTIGDDSLMDLDEPSESIDENPTHNDLT